MHAPTRIRSGLSIALIAAAIFAGAGCYYKSKAPLLTEYAPVNHRSILIRDVRLFTGKPGEPVREKMSVLVRGTRIERIYKTGKEAPEPGVKIIEGAGMTLMPGLIDAHTHLTAPTAPPWLTALPTPRRTLAAFLFAGVTTILDQGGDVDQVSELARRQRAGKVIGPRIHHPGKAFTSPDGHPASLIKLFVPWPVSNLLIGGTYHQIDGDDDVTELIAENKKKGASYTKVYLDEIPLNAPLMNEQALRKVVAASTKAGLPVMAHVGREAHLRMALRAGVRIFVHSPYRTPVGAETIRLMKARDAVMAPTVNVFQGVVDFGDRKLKLTPLDRKVLDKKELAAMDNIPPDFRPPAEFDGWLKASAKNSADKFANLRAYKAAGITLLAASDSPNVGSTPGGAIHREIQAFIKQGNHTPAQALSAATYFPGRLIESIGGRKGLGHIREGSPADLLLIEGKPDLDPGSLTRIREIILGGRRVIRKK